MDANSISEEAYLMHGHHSSSFSPLLKIPGYCLIFFPLIGIVNKIIIFFNGITMVQVCFCFVCLFYSCWLCNHLLESLDLKIKMLIRGIQIDEDHL